ncbi:MAG TPA: hypothetical protein VM509_01840 [Planctomycetota bacterium]|nr:hypothetical protein [Planctomycetota bacterium]
MSRATRFERVLRVGAAVVLLAASSFAAFQGLDATKKKLSDSNERVRQAAVKELAALSGAPAFELLLACLRDPSPMVADEAQLALAGADEEAELELFFSKDGAGAKDDLVRLRCAEALGRVEAKLGSARFSKLLADKEASVRRATAWSIERQAARQGIAESPAPILRKALAALAEHDPDSGVRAASVMALQALAPGLAAAEIQAFAADKAPEVRSAALLASAPLEPRLRRVLSQTALKDAHPGVRAQACDTLASVGDRESMILLADALAEEKSTSVVWRIVERLRALSGFKSGRDARAWQDWARALAADWKPGAPAASNSDGESRTATFAGLPMLSDRITFLIDLSGSMWKEQDGKTPKAGADRELELALTKLPATAQFNVIPFTGVPIPWQPSLQPATPKNVAAALAFFVKRKETGKGNFWDAMQLALEDPAVDTLILLGDGAPTGGTRWNVELMSQLHGEQNRFRHVTLNAVLVNCSKGLTRAWATWCTATGGQTRATDLR